MKKTAKRSIPKKTEKLIYQEANSKCAFCTTTDVHTLEIHHIKGWEEGGGNEPENLILVCGNCHAKITYGALSYADVTTKKRELYWTGRKTYGIAATAQDRPKPNVHQEIHGNGNVQSLNVFHAPPTTKTVMERREGSISPAECVQIRDWIEELAEGAIDMTRKEAYKAWWGHFKSAFHLAKYEELLSSQMDDARRWFQIKRASQINGLRTKAPDEWQRKRITAIKAAMGKMGISKQTYYPDVARRLKMRKPFASLKDLTKQDLQRVYNCARNDAAKSR